MSANKSTYIKQLNTFLADQIISPDTNSVVLDFVTYNGNHNTFIYSGFLFTAMAGGITLIDKFIMPMKLDIYYNPEDKLTAVIEILVVIGFFGLFYDSILKTYSDAVKYNRYEEGILHLLSAKDK